MAKIFYLEVDDFLRKEERYKLLENAGNVYNVDWSEIAPDKNHIWLTEGMEDDWDSLIPLGTKEAKQLSVVG
ncbi:MAG TPA: helicase, partial [Candidatus Kapabacteria bacterium]|nr:helicase [Candidatus Kapabacteria bacterium]